MKKTIFKFYVILLFFGFLFLPKNVLSSQVTIHFVGQVSNIYALNDYYTWDANEYFAVGDIFEGYFSYESDETAFWQAETAPFGSHSEYKTENINFSVGNISGTAVSSDLAISDGYYANMDQYTLWADTWDNSLTGTGYPYELITFGLGLYDGTEMAFNSSELLSTAPDLNDFNSTLLEISFGQGIKDDGINYSDYLYVSAFVTSIEQVTPVPEPNSMILFSLGIMGFAVIRYRR